MPVVSQVPTTHLASCKKGGQSVTTGLDN